VSQAQPHSSGTESRSNRTLPVKASKAPRPMRILAAIASYGTGNDVYLAQLVKQYRSMPFAVDIVVLSNLPKEVGSGVEVVVGLPSKNPWSLPFAHKRIFAERLEHYDLFIYSEDDILITERNIRAFLLASEVLPTDEIAGFLRFETDRNSDVHFADALGAFHWDPSWVKVRGRQTFSFFTNEHAAAYILTQQQLQRAIASGGFLVAPYEGKYDMLVTAATDPYTRCGMKKVISISSVDDFMVHHLSNKYIGKFGVTKAEFYRQIDALLKVKESDRRRALFTTETRLPHRVYSKVFYEPVRSEVLSLVPDGARDVLSIGCGWGAMEASLIAKGMRVVGIPLDSVIGACAEARGVEIIAEDFEAARSKLAGKRFDVLLMSNVLHLVSNPSDVLSSFASLLHRNSVAIIVVPNLASLPARRRILGKRPYRKLRGYEKLGIQLTSHRMIRRWLHNAGLQMEHTTRVLSRGAQKISRATLRLFDPLFAEEIIVLARKT